MMLSAVLRNTLTSMLVLIGGCDIDGVINESANKTEYSILEHYEYEFRNSEQEKPYMFFEHALGSKYTVVAFPIKHRVKGYVVILAQAEGVPKVKVLSKVEFKVTKEAYTSLKREVHLSKEVDQFIFAHIQ